MKRVLSYFFVATIVFTISSSCNKSTDTPSPVIIQSFTPEKGVPGTQVTITGTNFGATPGENTVKFNGSIATVISASATQLIVKVPLRASAGKITVISPAGTGKSEKDFDFLTINDTWAQANTLSAGGRRAAVSFVIGDKAYVATGLGSYGAHKDVWAYDASSDTWTQKADFAGKLRRYAVGFSIMGKGYVGLGNSGNLDFEKDLWQYDPGANSWTKKADYKGVGRESASAFTMGDKAYVGLGNDGADALLKDFYQYDPVTNTWTQKANLMGVARTLASGFSIGNKGYIAVGWIGNAYTDELWEYNPSSDAWTKKKSFPGASRGSAVAFTIGNKGYFGTGFGKTGSSNDYLKDIWEYDPTGDSWEKKADLPGSKRSEAIGFAVGNKGYIGLGINGNLLADFFEYTK